MPRLTTCLTAALLASLTVPAARGVEFLFQPEPEPLRSAAAEGIPSAGGAPLPHAFPEPVTVERIRRVELNPKVAGGEPERMAVGDRIELNLFDGRRHTARVDRVTENLHGTVTVRARVEGFAWGFVLISTTDGESLGSVEIPETGEHYHIQSAGSGGHFLSKVHHGGLSPGPCKALHPPIDQRTPLGTEKINPFAAEDPQEEVVVDVMIVYTPAAREWADTSGGGMFNLIAQAMEKANLAQENSGTFLTWNLVHAAEVAYVESGDSQLDLIRLTTSPEFAPFGETWEGQDVANSMDEVHTWRDDYGADLVALFSLAHDTGGVAWLLDSTAGTPDWGFGVTRVQQAGWTFTLAHELGHNFGLDHHPEQNHQPGPGIFHYSAGWRWIGPDMSAYSSVMTYESGTYFADGRTHVAVPYFSNPSVFHNSVPTGHPTFADNARTLRETKHAIANYRSLVSVTLGEGAGQPGWTWTTGGAEAWTAVGAGRESGGRSARSGAITHSQQTWIETTVEGPGVLRFWWKVSSEGGFDSLRVSVNQEEKKRISGEVDWKEETLILLPGSHTVRWLYAKDGSVSSGLDAGWLGEVSWTPGAIEPRNYAEWRAQANLPPDRTGIDDDPGGYGIPNWHRYALGLDPEHPDRSELPTVGTELVSVNGQEKRFLTLSFRRSQAASDIVYWPEASGDLANWKRLDLPEYLLRAEGDGNWQTLTYRDRVPMGEADSRFLRVGIRSRLGEAVGQPLQNWQTGGNKPWLVQGMSGRSANSSTANDAARSGTIGDGQASWVETTFEGPGSLTFWWKVSSESGWDYLSFLLNQEEITGISGEVDWEERTFLIPEGTHTVRWRYAKDRSLAEGEDAGWLDHVEWAPDPVAAGLAAQ